MFRGPRGRKPLYSSVHSTTWRVSVVLPTERNFTPWIYVFPWQISKLMTLSEEEHTKSLFAVSHPPAAPTESPWELQDTLCFSQSTQGHPWRSVLRSMLFTTLSFIICVYSGATKDGYRSANPLPRKIFSTAVIVIQSEGKHQQKLTAKQGHIFWRTAVGKRDSTTQCWLRVHGGGWAPT